MTFDDDHIVLESAAGFQRTTLKAQGLTWPPPERIANAAGVWVRQSYSTITDEERAAMSHVARGALYQLEKSLEAWADE
jgi:hypothetical protein